MTPKPASFVWYELMTSDCEGALSFYRSVFGWDAAPAGMGGSDYTILSVGPALMGGLMPIPPEACARGVGPRWRGYVAVADVDACAAQLEAAGGRVHRAPDDIPGVGRVAAVADPHGASFVLFNGTGSPPPPVAPDAPGHVGWRELHAGDGVAAFAFYSALFGWTKADAFEMGPLGTYQTFATGGQPVGGMMTKMADTPGPMWLYYFNVEAADAVAQRVTQAGGKVLMGPHPVPTGQWIVQFIDPQGAMFAIVAPKR